LRAAATDLGYSAAVLGSLPRGKGQLVEYFVENCDSRLSVDISMRYEELEGMFGKERLLAVMRWRLTMIEPVIETWVGRWRSTPNCPRDDHASLALEAKI
jgi:ubiquinone biosynthesis protein COQ9